MSIFKEAEDSILNHDKVKAEEIARRALDEGLDPLEVIERGFREGIKTRSRLPASLPLTPVAPD